MGNLSYRLLRHDEIPNQVKTFQILELSNACNIRDFQSFSAALDEGIGCLSNICRSLLDHPTAMCNYDQLREYIVHAEQCMGKAEKNINEKLGNLDQRMEQLIREKHNAEQQKKEKSLAVDKLQIEKRSAEESLKNSKVALGQARRNVESAQHALSVTKDRIYTSRGVAIAGGILLAFPFIGWIAGPIMLIEGLQQLNEASNFHNAAEEDRQMYESKVSECNERVLEYEGKIVLAQNEIEMTSVALRNVEGMIEKVQKDLKDTANDQQMVRRAVKLLGDLSGRVTVLEKQTQNVIFLEPVVNIMENVMNAVVIIAKNQLYCSDRGLINTLRENVGKLQVVCKSPAVTMMDMFDNLY
ncbi:uncharacterized protein LOC130565391 [Triplophysa rosa]|uniref:Uncharacterized protein n=1 Tax=Triplophysa rosa TaxID=992332 RepID=A0A9W7TNB0_TRIRA|nr:uncharacterized protein LOC130565391 [Triplophysa rosa]KAI7799536.1 hypothetical protein IRJ41_005367 [Triplophysa rosa]